MKITTSKGEHSLDNPAWGMLYKATSDGDIFRKSRIGDTWMPLVSLTARTSIWQIFKNNAHRIPWREVNNEDIQIAGFTRTFAPLGKNQRVGWFVCTSCNALYTDSQEHIDQLRGGGCQVHGCPNHRTS